MTKKMVPFFLVFMRCSPFVLFSDYTNLMEDTRLTNPHIVNLEAGMIYIFLMRSILYKSLPEIDQLMEYTSQSVIKEVLIDVKNKKIREIMDKSVKGWVCTALYCALYSIYHIPTFTEACSFFIHLKGDTDTNCAILGGLYGARDGFEKLYQENSTNFDLILKNKELEDIDSLLRTVLTLNLN